MNVWRNGSSCTARNTNYLHTPKGVGKQNLANLLLKQKKQPHGSKPITIFAVYIMMAKSYTKFMAPLLVLALVLLSSFSYLHLAQPDNPDFPAAPDSEELLFYIHRNKNSNTIVYQANIRQDGTLNSQEPLEVYWIKYDSDPDGIRKEINYIESILAFGFKVKPWKDRPGHYKMTLVSYKKESFDLYIDESGHARANFEIDGREAIIEKIFVQASETSWLPKVDFVELFGTDPVTGDPVYQKIYP